MIPRFAFPGLAGDVARGFLGRGAVAVAPPPAADFVVASDADWALIPASLWTNGGLIEVEPGTYNPGTIFQNRSPSAPLIFRAKNPATQLIGAYWQRQPSALAKSRIVNLRPLSSYNLQWHDFEITTTQWGGTTPACVLFSGQNGDLVFARNWIHAGYDGNPDVPLDPLKNDYKEYACIVPTYNASGVVTALTIQSAFIGNDVADGTYNLRFDSANGSVTYTTLPTGTFTVAGGNIVSTNLTGGGASNATLHTNNSLGILSKQIVWDAQPGLPAQRTMLGSLPWGFRGGSLTPNRNMTFDSNLLTDCGSAIKPTGLPTGASSTVLVTKNTFDRIYMDYFSMGYPANGNVQPRFILSWSFGTRPIAKGGDPGDPHIDFIQTFMNSNTSPWQDIQLFGNVFINGNTRGVAQVYFISDAPLAPYHPYVVGNIGAATVPQGLSIERSRYGYFAHNTIVSWDGASGSAPQYAVLAAQEGSSISLNNLVHIVTFATGAQQHVNRGFGSDSIVPFSAAGLNAAFVGQTSTLPTTLDEAIAHYASKGAAAGKGALAAPAYIDFATQTINKALERPYVRLTGVGEALLSFSYNTGWQRVVGGPNNMALSVVNGTVESADDELGTNPVANPSTVSPGKFIRVTSTSPATPNTPKSVTVTLNGFAYTWLIQTASGVQYSRVDNFDGANRAWSRFGTFSNGDTNDSAAQRFVFAWRTRDTQQANANAPIWGSPSNANFIGFNSTGATTRRIISLGGSAVNNWRLSAIVPAPDVWRKHLVIVDLTQPTFAEGVFWYIDGVLQAPGSFNTTTYTAGHSLNMATIFGSTNRSAMFATGTGGALATLQLEYFWATWGNSSFVLPDHYDPLVRAQFDPAAFASNGDTAGLACKLFMHGDKAAWDNNSTGLANRATAGPMAGNAAVRQGANLYTAV